MAKKNRICILLWLIVLVLLFCLWRLKINTVTESFDNAWTSLAKQTVNVGRNVGDYVSDNTGSVWDNENATDWEYENPGDIAQMRSRQSSVSYLATKENPTLAETVEMATYNPAVFSTDRFINAGDPNTTGLNSTRLNGANYTLNDVATDILNDTPNQKIKWDKVIVDTTNNGDDKISIVKKSMSNSYIIDDACSTKGFLNSNFKEDICSANGGNFNTINEKCQQLSPENCSIPSCCVLMDGNTCSAGNIRGPTYLTRSGQNVDFTYYYYKKKCYGAGCEMAKEYEAECNKYDNNSKGISKRCMIKMFNIHGCPNSAPNDLINDSMVQKYSLSSKKFVNNYIKTAVDILKQKIAETDDQISKNLCYGEPKQEKVESVSVGDGQPKPVESLDDVGGAINRGLDTLKFG